MRRFTSKKKHTIDHLTELVNSSFDHQYIETGKRHIKISFDEKHHANTKGFTVFFCVVNKISATALVSNGKNVVHSTLISTPVKCVLDVKNFLETV